MTDINIVKSKSQLMLLSFPLLVLVMQIIHPFAALIAGVLLIICAVCLPKQRTLLLTLGFIVLGHLCWRYTSQHMVSTFSLSPFPAKTVGRLGLIGYLALFAVWYAAAKPRNSFLRLGDGKAEVCFPYVWYGIRETVWRFTLIFSTMCLGAVAFFAITTEPSCNLIIYGILFALVNAVLEEFIWRGFILTRLLDIASEKSALLASSLAFGLYHYSLQFPLWTCLIFAVGGFYFGGSAIKSRGLLSPTIMHIMVNLIFVFSGMIF